MGTKDQKSHSSAVLEVNAESIELVDLIEKPAWKTILIDLVKTEKMDPWNIDIVELAEKYLQKINSLQEKNLRLSANAILASAMLLKFKSRVLRISSIDDEDDLVSAEMTPEQRQQIELDLPELQLLKSERQGKISLDDLVSSLEKILEKTKQKDRRVFGLNEVVEFRLPFADFDIEKMTVKVFEEICLLADSQGLLLFSRLTEGKNSIQIVDTFIASLFLTNKGKINMWQEEFYGEIFISIQKH